jgi:hypothetical protein
MAAGPEGGLDNRAWELVSPPDKNGGDIEAPGAKGTGALQAAAGGGALSFGSATSFGEGQGGPPVSQYLSSRTEAGWSTQNLSPSLFSGTYAAGAYLLFSEDLSRALLTNGWQCRVAPPCEAENPPLSPEAPTGYSNLYLREGSEYTPLITQADSSLLATPAAEFELALQGATPDLSDVVFSANTGLYEWSEGQVELISEAAGAALAAPSGAISADGSRVYFSQAGNLYLREGSSTVQVDEGQGGGGSFQTASADGSLAFFTKGEALYRYSAQSESSTQIATEVVGVLGASPDGSYLYYLTEQGLFLFHEGTTTAFAPGFPSASAATASDYPPATGTSRVSLGGNLAFLSSEKLTGFHNVGKAELFLYEAGAKHLLCASCNPRELTPAGPASIPGALSFGEGGVPAYKPRVLTEDGKRLFFTTSDALLFNDTDSRPDAYEWEAFGEGSCQKKAGCIALLSGGRTGEATFLDASATGQDAYFLTSTSLAFADSGGFDVYDAREAGGFPESPPQIPCEGDACQGPAPGPDDPTPGTATLEGPVNPPVHFPKEHRKKRHHKKHRHHHHKRGHR